MLTLYWNRRPGKFVNKKTGEHVDLNIKGQSPIFEGKVSEWYETLIETIIDLSNQLGRGRVKDDYDVYVSPDVLRILESTVLYKPMLKHGKGTLMGMRIHESRNVGRFEIEMEHGPERGRIIILDN